MVDNNHQDNAIQGIKNLKRLGTKMLKIMKDITYITNNAQAHNFNYADNTAILSAVRNSLIQHNVMAFYTVLSSSVELTTGTKGYCARVTVQITFTDVDSGECFSAQGAGFAIDARDKAIYAAITCAHKYLLLKSFCIPTGDDVERDYTVSKVASESQVGEIMELASKLRKPKDYVQKCLLTKGINDIMELKEFQANNWIISLKKALLSSKNTQKKEVVKNATATIINGKDAPVILANENQIGHIIGLAGKANKLEGYIEDVLNKKSLSALEELTSSQAKAWISALTGIVVNEEANNSV